MLLDEARWGRLWEHRAALLRVARRRTACPEDAEDAVHEALVRGAQAAHLTDEHLGAWLNTVTVRLCADTHRRREREHRAWTRTTPPQAVGGPEEGVCDRAEAAWLARIAADLPPRQAEAVRLRGGGLTVVQVARRLGTTAKAAELLLGRARRSVKASLAGTLVTVIAVWRGVLRSPQWSAAVPALAASVAALTPLVQDIGHQPAYAGPPKGAVEARVPAAVLAAPAPAKRATRQPPSPVSAPRSGEQPKRSAQQQAGRQLAVTPPAPDLSVVPSAPAIPSLVVPSVAAPVPPLAQPLAARVTLQVDPGAVARLPGAEPVEGGLSRLPDPPLATPHP